MSAPSSGQRRAGFWGLFLVLLLSLVSLPVLAQSTGGSFGGGSFGRRSGSTGSSSGSTGSSSGSSGWGGGSSSRSTSYGGSNRRRNTSFGGSSSSRSGSGKGIGAGGFCCLLVIGGIFLVVVIAKKKKGKSAGTSGGGGNYSGPDAMHVSKLSLGIDWRARGALQEQLKRLAETGDTGTPQGLTHLLRETVLALRRSEMSWLYVGFQNLGPLSPQNAEEQFRMLTTAVRAAYQHEAVRGADGQVVQNQTPEMQAKANEGAGTVVVHLLIASYRAVPTLTNPDANQIRMALDNRSALTDQQLAVLEVVWSPAEDADRMSSAELEQFYPEMRLIDPQSIAGRIFCGYCQGPFAMELLECPHCGAPAGDSQNNRAPR